MRMATKMKKRRSTFLQQPVQHLDPKGTKSLLDLVNAFQHTSFQSRNVFKCLKFFERCSMILPALSFWDCQGR